jgi:hypothetical protein
MSLFDGVGAWLFPEPEPHESRRVFKWRQVVSLAILLLGGSVLVGDALAWGLTPIVYPGFASLSIVEMLSAAQAEIREAQIERSILEDRERQCNAQREANVQALQFATQKLESSIDDYSRVTKRGYRVPDCNELITK